MLWCWGSNPELHAYWASILPPPKPYISAIFYLFCMCVFFSAKAIHVEVKGQLARVDFLFQYVGSRDQTQVGKLVSKPLNHLTGPSSPNNCPHRQASPGVDLVIFLLQPPKCCDLGEDKHIHLPTFLFLVYTEWISHEAWRELSGVRLGLQSL